MTRSVRSEIAVGKIESEAAHPGFDQALDHLRVGARRPQSGEDLGERMKEVME